MLKRIVEGVLPPFFFVPQKETETGG